MILIRIQLNKSNQLNDKLKCPFNYRLNAYSYQQAAIFNSFKLNLIGFCDCGESGLLLRFFSSSPTHDQ